MDREEQDLLSELYDADERGAFARACDGPDRAVAHRLSRKGYADWNGTTWGSSFWSITEAGRLATIAMRHNTPTPASPKRERYSDMAEAINRGVK